MIDLEFPLSGGQMTTVVRVGETVRRTVGPWSPAVHGLLRHLEEADFKGTPRFLGHDARQREVLTYIAGAAGFFSRERVVPFDLWSDEVVRQAGTFLRAFHDASIGLCLPDGVAWQPPWSNPQPHEIVCHGDFAPYNCIFRNGRLVAVIDLDGAAPGSRAWDLAYAAYTFVPLYTDDRCRASGLAELPDRGRRLRLLCDSYGLTDRAGFAELLEARVRDIATMVRVLAAAGDVRFQRKVDEGHPAGYLADAEFLNCVREELQGSLEV
jgi:hypothetical protein